MIQPGRTFKMQDLQQEGRKIVETATESGPVGLTRNGELVAGVVSVPDLAFLTRARELRDRAVWLLAAERGFREIDEGTMRDWREFAAEVRTRLGA